MEMTAAELFRKDDQELAEARNLMGSGISEEAFEDIMAREDLSDFGRMRLKMWHDLGYFKKPKPEDRPSGDTPTQDSQEKPPEKMTDEEYYALIFGENRSPRPDLSDEEYYAKYNPRRTAPPARPDLSDAEYYAKYYDKRNHEDDSPEAGGPPEGKATEKLLEK